MNRQAIRLDQAWCSFGDDRPVHALQGVDLSVDEGEFVAVVGPSGSGKSTLLYAVGGLRTLTRGTLDLMGHHDPPKRTMTQLRRTQIGFVFQAFHLLPHLSAVDNVATGARYGIRRAKERTRRARHLLERVGLGERVNHRPAQLSGGEQQRVAIARALVNAPPLILADEPTGNLDSATGMEILDLLRSIHSDGSTVVVVSHSSVVAAKADRIVGLEDGTVVRKSQDGLQHL